MPTKARHTHDGAWSIGTLVLRLAVSLITLTLVAALLIQPPEWLRESLPRSLAFALLAVAGIDLTFSVIRGIRTLVVPPVRHWWVMRQATDATPTRSAFERSTSVDRAIESVLEDRLGFAKYAFVLADFIADCFTPMTIGIHGEWGAGKTSLARLIEGFLRPRGAEWSTDERLDAVKQDLKRSGFDLDTELPRELVEKLEVLWLNAWQYADAQSLWRAFILTLARRLEDYGLVGSTEEWQTKLYYNVTQEGKGEVRLNSAAVALAACGAVAMFVGSLLLPSTWILLMLANLGLAGDAKFKLPSLDNVFERSKYTKMRKQMDSIDQFQPELQKLVQRLLDQHGSARDPERKVVVFIDDLDRCAPNVALEIMETIKTFLDVEGCVYVVLCDERLIGQGVKNKFKELFGDQDSAYQQRGREYIEKIVQISFNIPPVNSKALHEYAVGAMADMRRSGGRDIPYFEIVYAAVGDNPRKIKRLCRALEIAFRMMQVGLRRSWNQAPPDPAPGPSSAPPPAPSQANGQSVITDVPPGPAEVNENKGSAAPPPGRRPNAQRAFAKTFCLQYRWPEAMPALRRYAAGGRVDPLVVPASAEGLAKRARLSDMSLSGSQNSADQNLLETVTRLTELLYTDELQLFADLLLTVDWERASTVGEGAIKSRNTDLWSFLQIEPQFTQMDRDELRDYIEWSGVISRDEPVPESHPPVPPDLPPTTERLTSETGILAGKHLLWVDDLPDNNTRAKLRLEQAHAEVNERKSTREALDFIRTAVQLDAIITDQHRMEDGISDEEAGYKLLAELRSLGLRAPVILSTSSPDVERALAAGFFGATDSDGVFDLVVRALADQGVRPDQSAAVPA